MSWITAYWAGGLGLLIGLTLGLWIGTSRAPEPGGPNLRDEKLEAPGEGSVRDREALTREVESLKTQLRTADQEIQNLRTEIADLARSKEDLEQSRRELAKQKELLAEAQKDGTKAKERIASLEGKYTVYEIVRETPLLRNPYAGAEVIGRMSKRQRVKVERVVDGAWLKVQYFRAGNPPGYIRRDDAVPIGLRPAR